MSKYPPYRISENCYIQYSVVICYRKSFNICCSLHLNTIFTLITLNLLITHISSFNSLLARGTYNISGTYASSQIFKATVSPEPTEFVSLKILNNHGNNNYTCVYRLRVHGTVPQ